MVGTKNKMLDTKAESEVYIQKLIKNEGDYICIYLIAGYLLH
jgi:hypothetical protein